MVDESGNGKAAENRETPYGKMLLLFFHGMIIKFVKHEQVSPSLSNI